jgi:hypothetical protein
MSQSRECDHYHAVPLSDGHHVLFIDPSNGKLILGCDAPLGGPTKLLRKIVLISPEKEPVPRLYTAAADLSHGARIVVLYGETVMLYSVPPAILDFSQTKQKGDNSDTDMSPPGGPSITPRLAPKRTYGPSPSTVQKSAGSKVFANWQFKQSPNLPSGHSRIPRRVDPGNYKTT